MKPTRRSLLKAALIVIISAALLVAAAGPILSAVFSKKIKEKLEAANVHIGSLSINLFTRSISFKNVEWSTGENKARVNNIQAAGIRIIPFIQNREVKIRRILIEGGDVALERDTAKSDDVVPDSVGISSIDIERISFDNINLSLDKEYQAKVDATIHFLHVNNFREISAYEFRNIETRIRDLKIQKAGSLYAFKIKEGTFDKELKKFHIDSLSLEPLLNKDDFAKTVKSQETRTRLAIASVDATGVNMAVHMGDTSVMISSLSIDGAYVHAYKNKKYPFKRKEKFPLPMASFEALPFSIEVDTIKIHKTTITYEELPTEGFNTAHITFDDVDATVSRVNNREFKNLRPYAMLEASAHVMKTGEVKAKFKLPLKPKEKYSAEGTIKNVPLHELNPLLADLAFVEISTGRLNRMDFFFSYDDVASKGQVHFDYEDLRILGLKKEPEKGLAAFKTVLINTALKNDQTLNGNIDIARNQKKAVFNLWTISLVDGIRDAMVPVKKGKANKKGK